MAGLKALVLLSFSASIGLMFLILACALPRYNNWWPFFVITFYILSPVPTLFARKIHGTGTTNACFEFAWFITAGIIVSAFALPIVLARAPYDNPVIDLGACGLVLTGNVITFLTIWGFFVMADSDNIEYSMW